MTKEQLINYLETVREAEHAVQAINEVIDVYKYELRCIASPVPPVKPEPVKINLPKEHISSRSANVGCVFTVPLFIFYCILIGWPAYDIFNVQSPIAPLFIILISAVSSFFTVRYILQHFDQKRYSKEYESALAEAQHQTKQAELRYEENMIAYQKAHSISTATTEKLTFLCQIQQDYLTQAQERLSHLYNQDIVYPSFRNLIAVSQICEYLKMGISDTLEGPTGAYAQYMNDVHTQMICTSIADLKQAVVGAIHSLQVTLVNELHTINATVNEARTSFSRDISQLNSNITAMQHAIGSQLETQYKIASQHLSTIDQNLAITAHNQYIQQRFDKIDTYLLQAPIRPS
ncbi:MAG: hypothetical protein IJB81_07135 [Clostridia bacterium]|nr:hypothetical protein [Clostridia bacterium]